LFINYKPDKNIGDYLDFFKKAPEELNNLPDLPVWQAGGSQASYSIPLGLLKIIYYKSLTWLFRILPHNIK